MIQREIAMFGETSEHCSIQLSVDNTIIFNGDVDNSRYANISNLKKLFSFQSDVQFHGGYKIKIQCTEGSFTMMKSAVAYPCCYIDTNNKVYDGKCWRNINANVVDPKYLVRLNGELENQVNPEDKDIVGEWWYTVNQGDTIEYFHIIPNGHDNILFWLEDDYLEQFLQTRTIYHTSDDITGVSDFTHILTELRHMYPVTKKSVDLIKEDCRKEFYNG